MKILILAPYPPGEAPSQRFRFEQYLAALRKKGIAFDYEPFIDLPTWKILHKPGRYLQKAKGILSAFERRFRLLRQLRQYDYIFIHREASHIGPPVFEWLLARVFQKKIVYDFDDAIWLPNYSRHNARFHWLKNYGKVKKVMAWSYRVSAGNRYLAEFAGQFNPEVRVNPTTIDTVLQHNRCSNHLARVPVIGWTGTLTTIRYLAPVLPVLQQLEKRHRFVFEVIANENPGYQLKSFRFRYWQHSTEITDLLRFNLGLMPLVDDQWAKGKCGFKALQYMALGIPALVSPVGVNTNIVDHGVNGFICHNPEDWLNYLEMLLLDPERRKTMGKAARQKIEDCYSVKANTDNFLRLFS